MEILTNKNEIINQFESFFESIMNTTDIKITDLTKNIKIKMLELGARVLEKWFEQNIGTGYEGCKINKMINGENEKLRFINHVEKTFISSLGEIRLKRSYYQSKSFAYYPIEEKHSWLKDEYLPDVKELSCYVSMLEPYEMASEMLEKVGGINISSSTLQRITKSIGEKLVRNEDNLTTDSSYEKTSKNIDKLVISCDGTCINTENEWKEVKNGAIYEIKANTKGELHAINKSYISRIENCQDFGKRLYIESRRRCLGYAKQVITIGDGAKWIWDLFNNYYPNSIKIIDWYHATEHLWSIIELMFGNRENEQGKIFEKECEDLLYEGLISLLRVTIIDKMKELSIKEGSTRYESIIKALKYFITNENRMRYAEFEKNGYPIGSGVIEGACKHLVQIRMKRSGMKWSIKGAHDILQLRCLYLSNRWNEVENVIESDA